VAETPCAVVGLAPHGEVYRAIMLAIGEDGGLERLRDQPFPTLVTASRFPDVLGAGQAAVVGITAYQLEKALRRPFLHPRWGRALGFRPACFDARDCQTPDDLADLVLASSATPPFTPVGSYRGQALLDGGLVDNAPAFVAESWPGIEKVIVLLTRPAPPALVGRQGTRLYLAPGEVLPVGRWDYTRPEGVDVAIAKGEQDADAFEATLDSFLDGRLPDVRARRCRSSGDFGGPAVGWLTLHEQRGLDAIELPPQVADGLEHSVEGPLACAVLDGGAPVRQPHQAEIGRARLERVGDQVDGVSVAGVHGTLEVGKALRDVGTELVDELGDEVGFARRLQQPQVGERLVVERRRVGLLGSRRAAERDASWQRSRAFCSSSGRTGFET